jgi:hypothetical protein
MNLFDEIVPATPDKVNLYAPYFMKSTARRSVLPKAISLYNKGGLEGERLVQGGEKIPFVMSWAIQHLPGDLTRCTVRFNENPDFTYEINMMNAELIGFLIDWLMVLRDNNQRDFPQLFYQKLMRMEDLAPAAAAANN